MKKTNGIGVVACLIEMHFEAGGAERAVQLLLTVVERIKAKAGCQACWISRDGGEPHWIRFSEIWSTEAAFEAHVRSDEFRHVLMALDMCSEEPQVTIGKLSGRKGFEHLKDLRRGHTRNPGQNVRHQ